jgi:ElaB/YqjD/DUF883 family membrane-anchored ribosome-binding protein
MAEETRMTRLAEGESSSAPSAEVARARADIEQTRLALGDTLNQIQERLSPARLKEQAKESVREATIGRVKKMARNAGDKAGEAGRGLADVVRDNPVPLALIGLGAGWLLMNARKRTARNYEYNREHLLTERQPVGYEAGHIGPISRVERARQSVREAVHDAGDRVSETAHRVEERVSEVAHSVSERASDIAQSVRERVTDTPHIVADGASTVASKVSDAGSRISSRVSDMRASAQERMLRARYQYEETPWMGAAVAIGLGMAAGLAIPGSQREDELFGSRRDDLLDRARDVAREKYEAVRTVAQEVIQDTRDCAGESVRDHAREEGLISSGESRV